MRYKLIVLVWMIIFLIPGCENENKFPMSEDDFWKIIERSLNECGEDEYQDDCLESILIEHSAEEIINYYQIYEFLHSNAYRGDIWAAGMLLNGGHGSDDGYRYFRNWLISCGKDVYYRTLNNPDSLVTVDVDLSEDGQPDAEYEEFSYVPVIAYEKVTGGKDLYDYLGDGYTDDDSKWGNENYEDNKWLEQNLPQLWKKYGRFKIKADELSEQFTEKMNNINELEVEGLGLLTKGGAIYHKTLGKGIITSFLVMEEGLKGVSIEFPDDKNFSTIFYPLKLGQEVLSTEPFDN